MCALNLHRKNTNKINLSKPFLILIFKYYDAKIISNCSLYLHGSNFVKTTFTPIAISVFKIFHIQVDITGLKANSFVSFLYFIHFFNCKFCEELFIPFVSLSALLIYLFNVNRQFSKFKVKISLLTDKEIMHQKGKPSSR